MQARRKPVKTSRPYDATRRRERAQISRERVLQRGQARFLRDGYAATTLTAIAKDAGVSVETIYKSFGSKAGLVRAIRERALEGEGPVPAEHRADEVASSEADPVEIIGNWALLASEVAPRVAPILLLVRAAAASDAEMAALQRELDDSRLERMAHNATYLRDGGHLMRSVTVERARDVLFTYSAPEVFELLVLRQGWTVAAYSDFVRDGIRAALL